MSREWLGPTRRKRAKRRESNDTFQGSSQPETVPGESRWELPATKKAVQKELARCLRDPSHPQFNNENPASPLSPRHQTNAAQRRDRSPFAAWVESEDDGLSDNDLVRTESIHSDQDADGSGDEALEEVETEQTADDLMIPDSMEDDATRHPELLNASYASSHTTGRRQFVSRSGFTPSFNDSPQSIRRYASSAPSVESISTSSNDQASRRSSVDLPEENDDGLTFRSLRNSISPPAEVDPEHALQNDEESDVEHNAGTELSDTAHEHSADGAKTSDAEGRFEEPALDPEIGAMHDIRWELAGSWHDDGAIDFAEDRNSAIATRRKSMANMYQDEGLVALSGLVLGASIDNEDAKTLKGVSEDHRILLAYEVCMTTSPPILEGLVRGDFVERYRELPEMRALVQKMRVRTMDNKFSQPAIYANILVSERGRSPTAGQLLQVLDSIEEYATGQNDALAFRIDGFRPPLPSWRNRQIRYARRKYLMTKKDKSEIRSEARQQNVTCFIAALRERLMAIRREDHDKPLRHPLNEIGYTHKTAIRLEDHRKHRASNYIMNLVEAVCDALWPDVFHITQFVVYLCTQPEHAVVAEIVFTRLAQGYIFEGGGFSYYPAGRSNRSAMTYTSNDWEQFSKWVHTRIPVAETHKQEKALWQATKISRQKGYSAFETEVTKDLYQLAIRGLPLESVEQGYLDEVLSSLRQQLQDRKKDEEDALAKFVEVDLPEWKALTKAMVGYKTLLELVHEGSESQLETDDEL